MLRCVNYMLLQAAGSFWNPFYYEPLRRTLTMKLLYVDHKQVLIMTALDLTTLILLMVCYCVVYAAASTGPRFGLARHSDRKDTHYPQCALQQCLSDFSQCHCERPRAVAWIPGAVYQELFHSSTSGGTRCVALCIVFRLVHFISR